MDIIEETKKAIAMLDPEEREDWIRDLDWPFEGGLTKEDVGKAASLLLSASLQEKDAHVKDAIFSVLETAVRCNNIGSSFHWNVVVEQLPFLSPNSLIYALDMLGYSDHLAYVNVLKPYVHYDQIFVQLSALDSICQIWWNESGRDPHVQILTQKEARTHISFLLGNPKRHDLPRFTIKEQFQSIRDEVMENLEQWLNRQ